MIRSVDRRAMRPPVHRGQGSSTFLFGCQRGPRPGSEVQHMTTNELQRRQVLQLLGGAGLLALASCASKGGSSAGSASTPTTGASSTNLSPSGTIPEETAGPFPGDGSNGANALAQAGGV